MEGQRQKRSKGRKKLNGGRGGGDQGGGGVRCPIGAGVPSSRPGRSPSLSDQPNLSLSLASLSLFTFRRSLPFCVSCSSTLSRTISPDPSLRSRICAFWPSLPPGAFLPSRWAQHRRTPPSCSRRPGTLSVLNYGKRTLNDWQWQRAKEKDTVCTSGQSAQGYSTPEI